MPYRIQAIGLSDIGLVRENNEDVWASLPKQRFFVLADGMGGHQAGEVAARETVRFLCEAVDQKISIDEENISLDDVKSILMKAIKEANAHVFKMGRKDSELHGMGTTLCILYFHPKGIIYGHVGDSRIYRLREGKILQLTKDHSLLRELVEMGQIHENHADEFLYKNIITKAIGTEPLVEPTVRLDEVFKKDVYLICSDGLSDLVSKEELEIYLRNMKSLKETANALIHAAKDRGGHDNITVVIVRVQEKPEE